MANGGYTGALPARDDSPEAYSGVWDSQEQYAELAAGRWAQQTAGLAPRSVRLNSADSAYFSRTPGTAGNRRTWTWSGWVKKCNISSQQTLWSAGSTGTNRSNLLFQGTGELRFFNYAGSVDVNLITTPVFRDPSAWYHILAVADTTQPTAANRFKLFVNGSQITAFSTATYPSQSQDLVINSAIAHGIGRGEQSGGEYIDALVANIYFIDGQALEPEAFGFFDGAGIWQPRPYRGTYGTNGFYLDFSDNSAATATALGADRSGNGNNWSPNNISVGRTSVTSPAIYASSTLYTTVAAIIANATPLGNGGGSVSGKFLYVVMNDGGKVGTVAFSTGWDSIIRTHSYNPSTSAWTNTGSFGTTEHGSFTYSDNGAWAAYDLDNNGPAGFMVFSGFNSGNTPSDLYTGTVPTLISANFNTLVSINAGDDSLLDSPVNGRQSDTGLGGQVQGNYATWNPLISTTNLTNGNLSVVQPGTSAASRYSTIGMSSGKWYWEITVVKYANTVFGIRTPGGGTLETPYDSTGYGMGWRTSGGFFIGGSNTGSGSLSLAAGDVLGLGFDAGAGTLAFYKNGSLVHTLTANASYIGQTWFAGSQDSVAGNSDHDVNFGQRPFAYQNPGTNRPSADFKALCTANLPEPAIKRGDDYFQTLLYTGNGSTQTLSGLRFSPDLVWIKKRSAAGHGPWYDSVRGIGKAITSSLTNSEYTAGSTQELTAFNSDGFSLGTDYNFDVNTSSQTFVGWCWDAGSSTVTNTAGSITSSVRANPSSGFSIVGYTGTGSSGSLGHGLNVKPQLIIVKSRTQARDWLVYHASYGATQYMTLNGTGAAAATSSAWNNTEPTSTVFTIGNAAEINTNGSTNIAYCFAPVAGYSSFGSYVGNGSSDGPMIATMFRPAWVLIKCSTQATYWNLKDNKRYGYNPTDPVLHPNLSDAESATQGIDFCSNGFKIRTSDGGYNTNGATYVWAAFAESPFQYSRAR